MWLGYSTNLDVLSISIFFDTILIPTYLSRAALPRTTYLPTSLTSNIIPKLVSKRKLFQLNSISIFSRHQGLECVLLASQIRLIPDTYFFSSARRTVELGLLFQITWI